MIRAPARPASSCAPTTRSARAAICTFSSSAPGDAHTLEVTVSTTYQYQGQTLSGATTLTDVTYDLP